MHPTEGGRYSNICMVFAGVAGKMKAEAVLSSPDRVERSFMIIILGVMAVSGGGVFLLMTGENRTRRPQNVGPTLPQPKKDRVEGLD